MEEKKLPLFRKIDQALFEKIDKFKQTPNYTPIQDFYNSLEEEQQKLFKGVVILFIFLLPIMGLTMVWWQNGVYKDNLEMRKNLVARANEIIGQSQSLQDITPQVFSMNPIDSQSMMTSRLSSLLSSVGVDLSKIQVADFESVNVSSNVMRSEAKFSFTNLSTDELMNLLTAMTSREKFRVPAVEITRNEDTQLLSGYFQAIHFSSFTQSAGEEE